MQDEVIFKSYKCQMAFWHLSLPENAKTGEFVNNFLKKKGGGYGLMLSGFVTLDGFVVLTQTEVDAINALRAAKTYHLYIQ